MARDQVESGVYTRWVPLIKSLLYNSPLSAAQYAFSGMLSR